MADPKKASQRRGATMTKRQPAGAKATPQRTATSPSRQRKPQAQSGAPASKQGRNLRGRASLRRKSAGIHGAGGMDSVLAGRLETIAQSLGQIAELRAEVEGLRAIVEKLAQTVSALTSNSPAESGAPEEAPPAATEEVLVIETDSVSAAEEEQPELEGAA